MPPQGFPVRPQDPNQNPFNGPPLQQQPQPRPYYPQQQPQYPYNNARRDDDEQSEDHYSMNSSTARLAGAPAFYDQSSGFFLSLLPFGPSSSQSFSQAMRVPQRCSAVLMTPPLILIPVYPAWVPSQTPLWPLQSTTLPGPLTVRYPCPPKK